MSYSESCDGCKFWSELVAQKLGGGPMQALCLNPNSAEYQKMAHAGCFVYEAGRAIDDPCPVASEINHDNWGNEGP